MTPPLAAMNFLEKAVNKYGAMALQRGDNVSPTARHPAWTRPRQPFPGERSLPVQPAVPLSGDQTKGIHNRGINFLLHVPPQAWIAQRACICVPSGAVYACPNFSTGISTIVCPSAVPVGNALHLDRLPESDAHVRRQEGSLPTQTGPSSCQILFREAGWCTRCL